MNFENLFAGWLFFFAETKFLTPMQTLRFSILALAFLVSIPVFGQITVEGNTFPMPGDTLRLDVAIDPAITLGSPGGNQFWDYSSLSGQQNPPQTVVSPDQGSASAAFPEANVLLLSGPNIENYFRRTDTDFSQLGFSGPDPINFGLNLEVKYLDPLLERFAPMNYPDVVLDDASFRIAVAWDDLPGGLTDSLGNFPILPDSIALKFNFQTIFQVDAWGNLQLKDGTREVLRVKRTRIQNASVEAKVVAFWIDITDLIQIPLFQQFQQDTTIVYQYFSASDKLPVVTLTMADDQQTVAQATFLPQGSVTSTRPIGGQLSGKPEISAWPNPSYGQVKFKASQLSPQGKYTIRIISLAGNIVREIPISSVRSTAEINLAELPQGAYLYTLQEEGGMPITARRLLLVKP